MLRFVPFLQVSFEDLLTATTNDLVEGFLKLLPYAVIGLVVFGVFLIIARIARGIIIQVGERTRLDVTLARILGSIASFAVTLLGTGRVGGGQRLPEQVGGGTAVRRGQQVRPAPGLEVHVALARRPVRHDEPVLPDHQLVVHAVPGVAGPFQNEVESIGECDAAPGETGGKGELALQLAVHPDETTVGVDDADAVRDVVRNPELEPVRAHCEAHGLEFDSARLR